MKKVIFLGYDKNETRVISFIKRNFKIIVDQKKKLPHINHLIHYDLIVSYGLREKIPKKYIKVLKKKIINLHISYLPYNRGSHPNFWSWVKDTPKGITIHFINNIIDGGDIIFQKKIFFTDNNISFLRSYNILRKKMDFFFIQNILKIINKNFISKKQPKIYNNTFYKKDLPKNLKSWDVNIHDYLKDEKK
jgi:methionyl-tRNA formyltransferase